ncbi:hypothetical protein BVY01_04050 [bacterium I07]|nr:hypothetical protein BVY01_04050 [bacterium I07]
MNPCERYKQYIMANLDGELDRSSLGELEKHLQNCPGCEALIKRVKALKGVLHDLPPVGASEDFQVILRNRIRRQMASQMRRPSRMRSMRTVPAYVRFAPAFGLGALMIVTALWWVNRGKDIPVTAPAGGSQSVAGVQESIPENEPVQYVSEEIPTTLSVSRDERQPRSLDNTVNIDSLIMPANRQTAKPILVPVSF